MIVKSFDVRFQVESSKKRLLELLDLIEPYMRNRDLESVLVSVDDNVLSVSVLTRGREPRELIEWARKFNPLVDVTVDFVHDSDKYLFEYGLTTYYHATVRNRDFVPDFVPIRRLREVIEKNFDEISEVSIYKDILCRSLYITYSYQGEVSISDALELAEKLLDTFLDDVEVSIYIEREKNTAEMYLTISDPSVVEHYGMELYREYEVCRDAMYKSGWKVRVYHVELDDGRMLTPGTTDEFKKILDAYRDRIVRIKIRNVEN